MNKKFQVFISSTYEDLKIERQRVQDIVLSMYQIPIGMEMFSAADEEQWEIIKDHIDNSDFYVLIIGHRYGSVIEDGPDAGISYTEKEYNYAVDNGIPVLVFIIDKTAPTTIEKIEKNSDSIPKLQSFVKKVTTGRVVEWWINADDLSTKVMNSLSKQILKDKRPGWVRASSVSPKLKGTEVPTNSDNKKKPVVNNEVSSKHLADEIKPEIVIDNDTDKQNDKLEYDIYRKYHSVISPLITEIEIRDGSFPVEILNEIRAVFTHIVRYKINNSLLDLYKAESDILRGIVDAYKHLCLAVMDKYDTMIKSPKKSIFKSSEIPTKLIALRESAKKKLLKAKMSETQANSDFEMVFHLYEEAYLGFHALDEELDLYINSLISN